MPEKLNSLLVKSQSAVDAGAGGVKSAIEEATVPDTLLARIVEEGRTEQGSIAESREFICSFANDVLTPAHRRLREELADGKWAWRSIHALAGKAGVDDETALDILRLDAGVELGRAKTGKLIARLKTRVAG